MLEQASSGSHCFIDSARIADCPVRECALTCSLAYLMWPSMALLTLSGSVRCAQLSYQSWSYLLHEGQALDRRKSIV